MERLFSLGGLAGIIAVASSILAAVGYPAAGAFLSDPHTAEAVTHLVNGGIALWAGLASNGKHAAPTFPTPPIARR